MGEHGHPRNGYSITYWRRADGSTVAATDEEEWTHVAVYTHGVFPVQMDFERASKEQMITFELLNRFLDRVYESGMWAAKYELRKWLGVPEKF